MNIKSCIYPIFFSGIGYIVYRSYNYNKMIVERELIRLKLEDKDYNPFIQRYK